MRTPPYFQTDDIPADAPKKDCIHTYYKVEKNGSVIKEGRYAHKQTRDIPDRTIYKRRWNQSKMEWKDSQWIKT